MIAYHHLQIQLFSSQCIHQKTIFTAFGLFTVDFSLLLMVRRFITFFFIVIEHDILHLQITGAIVTYLIFLIQFALATNKALSTVPGANGINGTKNGTGIINGTG